MYIHVYVAIDIHTQECNHCLRFRYSDQEGPDINVYNKEYFDNHSSYTFLL